MGTVSKEIADRVIAGEYAEDGVVKIVRYDNAFGGENYGLIMEDQNLDTYRESGFVQNPTVYWEKKK
jgi:hypothetical protein